MKLNSIKSVHSLANTLYGVNIDESNFEDIVLNGWELIGNRQIKLYKYTTNTENGRVKLPCNVDYIEAVFSPYADAQTSQPTSAYPNIYNEWTEQYIESWKRNKSAFYNSGSLISYHLEGDELVCDRDYPRLTILYRGVLVDDEGLPYVTNKEIQALAAYCAYVDTYKRSLMQKDGNLLQLSNVLKADWWRLCNSARVSEHLSQNELNDILDVKTRWDRHMFGKSTKPIL